MASPNYANLLRASRIAALPSPIRSSPSEFFPTIPSITTSKAAHNQGDWGLKRSLPKLKTQHIQVKAMDTQEHQTPFDPSDRHVKFVKRWQETGFPLEGMYGTGEHLFSRNTLIPDRYANVKANDGIYLPSLSGKNTKKFLRKVRASRNAFAAKYPEVNSPHSKQVSSMLQKSVAPFLNIVDSAPFATHASGGLGYHPPGALSMYNTPEGPREKQIIARNLKPNRSNNLIGVGGVVAEISKEDATRTDQNREQSSTFVVYPHQAHFTATGALSLRPTTIGSTDGHNSFAQRKRTANAWMKYSREEPNYFAPQEPASLGADNLDGKNDIQRSSFAGLANLLRSSPLSASRKNQGRPASRSQGKSDPDLNSTE